MNFWNVLELKNARDLKITETEKEEKNPANQQKRKTEGKKWFKKGSKIFPSFWATSKIFPKPVGTTVRKAQVACPFFFE